MQSSHEHADLAASHPAAGGAGDAPVDGHLCQERLLRGGAGAGSSRATTGEKTLQHPSPYGQFCLFWDFVGRGVGKGGS